MHLELRHLRTIRAIHDQGGLARAAEVLNITQSALSHQVRALEDQAGTVLFLRQTKPMRLSPAGLRLLALARQVLPLVEAAESEMRGVTQGRIGRLHVAMECHACFNWLLPALDAFRHLWPQVDIDVRAGLAFTALPALIRGEADLVVSSDPEELPGVTFEPLDVFSHFLDPAGVRPAAVREIELTDVILLLVASGRGVSVLPDWVLQREAGNPDLVTLPLGPSGVTRRLYAALREEDRKTGFMQDILRLAREGR